MEVILLIIAIFSLSSCVYALEIVKCGRKPRNGEAEEINRIQRKINKHYVRKS